MVVPACRPSLSSESAPSNSVGWMLGSTPPSHCQHAGEAWWQQCLLHYMERHHSLYTLGHDPSKPGRLMQSMPLCTACTVLAHRCPLAAGPMPSAHGSSQSKNGAAPKQHPSYGLLEKNGFQPEKYETYMKRCLQERAAQGEPLCMFQTVCACLGCRGFNDCP